MSIKLKLSYFLLFIILFVTEVLIAAYVHDDFVRPYAGDFLVVIMLYVLVRSILNIEAIPAALAVLLFAYLIELSQYLNLVQILGLEHNNIARTVMGSSFSWTDILAYTLGIVLVIGIEKIRLNKFQN